MSTKGYWTTKEGKKLKISDMEESHIKNCIAMLKRNMPDHEDDETVCADFPESMDWMQSCYTELGSKHYHAKITEFEDELISRASLGGPEQEYHNGK